MNTSLAVSAANIFDGDVWHRDAALLVDDERISRIVPSAEIPSSYQQRPAQAPWLVPGFVDLQVNGGGGLLLNDAPSLASIETICKAHLQLGTTALLPTLITATAADTEAALAAAKQAHQQSVPGFLGLHLEGPHLAPTRFGAHDRDLVRAMTDQDVNLLCASAAEIPHLKVTLATESVSRTQVQQLAEAGIVVSLGHCDADCQTALAYVDAGARLVTHLFNAMSPLSHRQPGLVGAALHSGRLSAGLIADGVHVDPVAIRIALAAKNGPGRIFTVTDAMAVAGTTLSGFTLNGRQINRRDGRLTLADGTLAGADIDLPASLRFLCQHVGVSTDEALRMATCYPIEALGGDIKKGRLAPGYDADFLELNDDFGVQAVWLAGHRQFERN